jgi:hypothetical protein
MSSYRLVNLPCLLEDSNQRICQVSLGIAQSHRSEEHPRFTSGTMSSVQALSEAPTVVHQPCADYSMGLHFGHRVSVPRASQVRTVINSEGSIRATHIPGLRRSLGE